MVASSSASRATAGGGAPAGRRQAVEKARQASPLPWAAMPPVWAMPRQARRARRWSWRASRGASVARRMMQEPASASGSGAGSGATGAGSGSRSHRPAGSPSTVSCSRRPKLASTRTPRVYPSARREAVPMPALKPKARRPAPAPTDPWVTGPAAAAARAVRTWASPTGRLWPSLSQPSLHSRTTGLTETRSGFCSMHQETRASATRKVLRVPVSSTGVSSAPSSATWVRPVPFMKPLRTKAAAGTFSRIRLPPWGSTAVTPVRQGPRPSARDPASAQMVQCPTRTPGTSVMALAGPTGRAPTARPSSRGEGRLTRFTSAMGSSSPPGRTPRATMATAATLWMAWARIDAHRSPV